MATNQIFSPKKSLLQNFSISNLFLNLKFGASFERSMARAIRSIFNLFSSRKKRKKCVIGRRLPRAHFVRLTRPIRASFHLFFHLFSERGKIPRNSSATRMRENEKWEKKEERNRKTNEKRDFVKKKKRNDKEKPETARSRPQVGN
jgi:hypothetical protein